MSIHIVIIPGLWSREKVSHFLFFFHIFLFYLHSLLLSFSFGKVKPFQQCPQFIETVSIKITFMQLASCHFRSRLVISFGWATVLMKPALKFCFSCRSISSAQRIKWLFCALSISPRNQAFKFLPESPGKRHCVDVAEHRRRKK